MNDTPANATHWTGSPAGSRRVYAIDQPGMAPVDVLDPYTLPAELAGDEALEGLRHTWAVVGRRAETIGAPEITWLRRDGL